MLVGTRDIDPPEQAWLDQVEIAVVPVGENMADTLSRVIDGRPVYVHIDCDVLEPGTVPTDYRVPGGMTLTKLKECAHVLAQSELVGIEIGELEADDSLDSEPARTIVDALRPLLSPATNPPVE